MKNIYFYYCALILPFAILILLMNNKYINSWVFFGLIIFYTVVYRTYIDGLRLVSKGIIKKSEIWKIAYNGSRFQYFKELYFK
ncbi:hypothetical protein [Gillisia marina]|uniref:hypothetical protein n=1 Tax=Gillisia marina TaxID=1167637 RepID=UPI00029B0947|nr:hypothetical protein [Gillisia marina]